VNSNSNPELEEFIFNLITEDRYVDILPSLEPGIVLGVIHAAFSLSNVITDIREFPDLIENARTKADTLYAVLYVKICSAMPYKLDELKTKSLNELLELFAIAENITGKPVELTKLREAIAMNAPSSVKKDKKAPAEMIAPEQMDSLKKQLDFLQEIDIDDNGRYIGDMAMI
jgi:hypothetical protein